MVIGPNGEGSVGSTAQVVAGKSPPKEQRCQLTNSLSQNGLEKGTRKEDTGKMCCFFATRSWKDTRKVCHEPRRSEPLHVPVMSAGDGPIAKSCAAQLGIGPGTVAGNNGGLVWESEGYFFIFKSSHLFFRDWFSTCQTQFANSSDVIPDNALARWLVSWHLLQTINRINF